MYRPKKLKTWAQATLIASIILTIVLVVPDVAWAQDIDAQPIKNAFKKGRIFLIVIAVGFLGFCGIDIAMKIFQEEHGAKKRLFQCAGAIALLACLERVITWVESIVTAA